MSSSQSLLAPLAAASLAIVVAFGLALAEPSKEFEPEVGQPGKDVIWVPTAQALVDKMLDMAKVTPSDFVIDLGSGDGRTVITAAKRGAKALGIEYNPDMVALSKRNAAAAGVADRATFMEGRSVRDRFLAGDRDHHVPVAEHQHQAQAENPGDAAGHPRGVELLRHGRLDVGGDGRGGRGLPHLLPGAFLARAGEGRGHLEAARRRRIAPASRPTR